MKTFEKIKEFSDNRMRKYGRKVDTNIFSYVNLCRLIGKPNGIDADEDEKCFVWLVRQDKHPAGMHGMFEYSIKHYVDTDETIFIAKTFNQAMYAVMHVGPVIKDMAPIEAN